MKKNEIFIRDPFVLVEDGKYYLYGSRGENVWSGKEDGFDVYVSEDLKDFEGPYEVFRAPEGFWADENFWAPEVHKYNGKFYMFASLKKEGIRRGTQIFVADSPMGPFKIHSDGPVTPPEWECLDGTLYVDTDQTPYMFFCHEWTQVVDGQVCVMELSKDLTHRVGEPKILFKGSDPAWTKKNEKQYVTDGPFIYRCSGGTLIMIWSGFSKNGYVLSTARSVSGNVFGPWTMDETPLFDDNGGHGMIFKNLTGELMVTLHTPNTHPFERPEFFEIIEESESLRRK